MKFIPRTKDEWVALGLIPFKVYVVIALPLFVIFRSFAATRIDGRSSAANTFTAVYLGYLVCVVALLFGAVVQAAACQRGAATRTILFVGYCVLLYLFWHR